MIKVCHLTSVHLPTDTRILLKECHSLAHNGYDVVFIVPTNRETAHNGVIIKAVPIVGNRFWRMCLLPWMVLSRAIGEKADIYHFHDPELIPVGICLKILGHRVIYDSHESVSGDILTKSYIPFPFRRLISTTIGWLESLGARLFDGIIAATPFIAQSFPPQKTAVIQNFPLPDELSVGGRGHNDVKGTRLIYMGSISDIRGIKEMVRAMDLLPPNRDVRLLLVGRFSSQAFEDEIRSLPGWGMVDFYPWQDRTALAEMISGCLLGLILLHPAPNHYNAYPNKLFEYMSAGLPVLASDFPLWREIVLGSGCGRLVDPVDPKAIAGEIDWFLSHPKESAEMGELGRKAILESFNWRNEEGKLVEFYRRVLRGNQVLQ